MTTAHRPTFDPARGKDAARGEAYHQRLLPAHKILKYRQATQGAPSEQARRDLRAELLRNERVHFAKKEGRTIEEDGGDERMLAIEEGAAAGGVKRALENGNGEVEVAGEGEEDYEAKKRRVLEESKDIDADSDSGSSSEEEEDSDDEDEEAELHRELA